MTTAAGIAVTSPTDIEKAIEAHLVARFEAFKAARRQQNMRYIFTDPAAAVAVFDGKIEKVSMTTFRILCTVHVQLSMTNAAGEESRRDGINPLVFGVIRTLSRQRFGLKITDLMPKTFKDVTSDEDWKNNKIVYDLEFTTSFNIEIETETELDDLLAVGLNYFLRPGDDLADAVDTVNFEL